MKNEILEESSCCNSIYYYTIYQNWCERGDIGNAYFALKMSIFVANLLYIRPETITHFNPGISWHKQKRISEHLKKTLLTFKSSELVQISSNETFKLYFNDRYIVG